MNNKYKNFRTSILNKYRKFRTSILILWRPYSTPKLLGTRGSIPFNTKKGEIAVWTLTSRFCKLYWW